MKVALITIATCEAYRNYARNLHRSALEYFPEAEFVLFSDHEENPGVKNWFYTPAKGYPNETLYRYATMLKQRETLEKYDQIFWVDTDMQFVAPVEIIFSYGLLATLHPGYVGSRGTPETRHESWAYCPNNTKYFCGGFQGGDSQHYLSAAEYMAKGIDEDAKHGIRAIWNDESHWNAYLTKNPPSKVLSPSYCYPEDYQGQWGWKPEEYKPVLVALDKNKRGNHWSQK